MVCNECKNQLREGAKFCGQCGNKTELGKESSFIKTVGAGYSSKILAVNATGPDSDGDMNVEVRFSITNQSGSSWDQLITRTQLISDSGYIEETTDTHEQLVEDGETEEFEISFYGVKARPFMASPEKGKVVINLIACTATSKNFDEVELPTSSFEVVKIEPCQISNAIQLISGGVWRTDPDDDKDVRVETRWLVKNTSGDSMPEVKFIAEVVGNGGIDIGDAGGYEELGPFAKAVVSGSTYAKEKKLKGAKLGLSARVMSPTASGSIEHIGIGFGPTEANKEIAQSDKEENDVESEVAGPKNRSLSGSTFFEWKMDSGEINMDDVEEDDVRVALKIALGLAKEEKYEEAVKALPTINFEYAFGNLDSDSSDYFGEPADISFELDLANPKHSIAVGVSDGKLVISIAVVFEIPVQSDVDKDELNEWLGDNGGYAAGFAAGGWSYNGDEGGHMMAAGDPE